MAASKKPVLGSPLLSYSIDGMSKSALIDFAIDQAKRTIGENAPEAEILAWIEEAARPIYIAREENAPRLQSRWRSWLAHAKKYYLNREQLPPPYLAQIID